MILTKRLLKGLESEVILRKNADGKLLGLFPYTFFQQERYLSLVMLEGGNKDFRNYHTVIKETAPISISSEGVSEFIEELVKRHGSPLKTILIRDENKYDVLLTHKIRNRA